ncbi:MAG: response regulator transcription factor [Pseudomonadota bacterium]
MSALIIADDHPLFRSALEQLLSVKYPDKTVVTVPDVAGLQTAVEANKDIEAVLLDLHMPGAHGFSALCWLTGQHPQTPVIVVSANTLPETVRRALDHGASAFLSKSADITALENGIAQVLTGARGIHPGLSPAPEGAALEAMEVAEALGSLTPAQFRVASMLAEGLLNKQIAYELAVKEATIKAHMTEIFRKLRVHSRTQAVLALAALSVEPGPDNSAMD